MTITAFLIICLAIFIGAGVEYAIQKAGNAYYSSHGGIHYPQGEGMWQVFARHHEERHRWQDQQGLLGFGMNVMAISLLLSAGLQLWEPSLVGFFSFLALEIDADIYGARMVWDYETEDHD